MRPDVFIAHSSPDATRLTALPSRRRSTLPSTAGEPRFTGRSQQLSAIQAALKEHGLAVVYGGPGFGKSRLIKEYAREHAEEYPGGVFFIRFGDGTPPIDLAQLLRELDQTPYPDEPFEDQCRRALGFIGAEAPTLVLYDGIRDDKILRDWLPPAGLAWHLIATTNFSDWPSTWSTVACNALTEPEALNLVGHILKDEAATTQFAPTLVKRAGGVTIELTASALFAAARLRKGRTVELEETLANSTISSFDAPWSLLSEDLQRLLSAACMFASTRVSANLLHPVLASLGWSAPEVDDGIDVVRGSGLATGYGDDLEIHQLVAQFVRDRGASFINDLRRPVFNSVVEIAKQFLATPGNLALRARLLAYDLRHSEWQAILPDADVLYEIGWALAEVGQFREAQPWYQQAVAASEKEAERGPSDPNLLGHSLQQVGRCLSEQGRFEEALPWYQRAIKTREKGDVHGRVNHEGLGCGLYEIGVCLSIERRYAEALPWFQKAIEALEKGDFQGHVNYLSLGHSLHQVGFCLAEQGRFEEALPWYQRAIEAEEKGDLHGRVDYRSLGRTLHQIGVGLGRQGRFADAEAWIQRAIEAKKKGDVHGRVDYESLGLSLEQVGVCLSGQGREEEAQQWYQRAATALAQAQSR